MNSTRLDDIVAKCDAFEKRRADGPFQEMEAKLQGKVRDPAAVAAKIAREELGQKEMTRRSVAGREK